MSPQIALLAWFVLLLVLLCFDPAREPKTSWALWIPLTWLFIAASRLPSQWIGGGVVDAAQAVEEGDSLDRVIYSVLIVFSIGVLISRSFNWGEFFRKNLALTTFFSFSLLSVLWSDFPLIALKRWFRDTGDYLAVLVVLSDERSFDAVRIVLRRIGVLLIPLSIVFIKYYPALGKHFSYWSGATEYVGVATSKNTLGGLCLVSGIVFFWDSATRWPNRKARRTKRIIVVNAALLAMTLWLLNLSESTTSQVCLLLGCLVVAVCHSTFRKRHTRFVKLAIPAVIFVYLTLVFGFGFNFAAAVGKDPTLTGRTVIWHAVLSTHTNPLLGTGYESFWLGPRLFQVWAQTGSGINEAHNAYLDIYLTLGLIGLFLLLAFMIASYSTSARTLERPLSRASLGMAMWLVLLFSGITEAVFKNGFEWMVFLAGTVVVSQPRTQNRRIASSHLHRPPVEQKVS